MLGSARVCLDPPRSVTVPIRDGSESLHLNHYEKHPSSIDGPSHHQQNPIIQMNLIQMLVEMSIKAVDTIGNYST